MAVVKINAIEVPEGNGPELERRFESTYESLRQTQGFRDFALLRPTSGEHRYFVYTKWDTEEDFQNWKGEHSDSQHAESRRKGTVSSGASLLEFEVALETHADPSA